MSGLPCPLTDGTMLDEHDAEMIARAFGFKSAAHFDDVLAGRSPSALAEANTWRSR